MNSAGLNMNDEFLKSALSVSNSSDSDGNVNLQIPGFVDYTKSAEHSKEVYSSSHANTAKNQSS